MMKISTGSLVQQEEGTCMNACG